MNRCRFSVIPLVLVILASLLLAGCMSNKPKQIKTGVAAPVVGENFDVFSGEYENTPFMKQSPPASIAVLPFGGDPGNWTLPPEADDPRDVIRRGMYNNLASLPFADQELSETNTRLAAVELNDAQAVAKALADNPARLHSLLGVDAVVLGEVTHFDRTFMGVISQAAVGCTVRMVAVPSGKLLWRATHVSRGFGGGVSISPIGLAMSAFSSLWNMREEQLYREADALFREMTSTVLVSDAARTALRPPVIDLFDAQIPEGYVRADGAVVFRVVGTPAARAFVELPELSKTVELKPVSPSKRAALRGQLLASLREDMGNVASDVSPNILAAALKEIDSREVFEGIYRPDPGDEATDVSAKALIVDPVGGRAVRLLGRTMDVDATPPPAPAGLRVTAADSRLTVKWAPVRENDLAAYEVWISPRGLSGYEKVISTEDTEAAISDLTNFEPRFVRVTALDKAGNRSAMTPMKKATPMPVSTLAKSAAKTSVLKGTIHRPLFLSREFSPYTVQRTLNVVDGGELHIAPGVTVNFAPSASLSINGGILQTYGSASAPVVLAPAVANGNWKGVALKPDSTVKLQGTLITNARIGLRIQQASATLEKTQIAHSEQAAIILETEATASVNCSTISHNAGMGGVVVQGNGVKATFINTIFNENQPFNVQNFSGYKLEMTENYWMDGEKILGQANTANPLGKQPSNCPNN